MRPRGVRAGLLAVALSGSVVACGDTAAAPAGLSATVEQSRDNENRGLLQLVLRNDGEAPVHVRRLQLDSPGYEPAVATVFDDRVRPGTRTAFPVEYGPVRCDVENPAGSVVVVGLLDGGSPREVRLEVPDDDPLLPRLHARDCALRRLGDAVRVAFGTDWVRDGDLVRGSLSLQRRSGTDAVRLTELQSSILYLLQPTGPLPLELPADEQTAWLPVELRAVRCDPHALIESKRSYTFPLYLALEDDEPLQTSVTADPTGQVLLEALLREQCAAEGGPI